MTATYLTLGLIMSALSVDANADSATVDAAASLSSLERRGKQIYLRGDSSSGEPVLAILGDPPMEVSAKMLPCVNCHGYEGRGITEGGVTPSNISWTALTKKYGTIHPSGRRHGPYNEETLARALAEGIDPAGNRLGVGMPKFRMSEGDLEAIIAYVKRVETDSDPGITDSTITLATVLPLQGALSYIGFEIKSVLTARVEELNREGGVYNRKIDLQIIEATDSPTESIARLAALLDSKDVFAIIAPLVPEGEDQLAALAEEREIPVIASLGTSPDDRDGPNRFLFYLFPARSVQARALVEHGAEKMNGKQDAKAVLVARKGEPFSSVARAIEDQCRKRGLRLTVVAPYDPETFSPERLAWELLQSDVLFFVGPDSDCTRVLKKVEKNGRVPDVYLIGTFLGEQIFQSPRAFQGKIAAVFPNSPSSKTERADKQYKDFFERNALPRPRSSASLAAYCATKVLFEVLNASGRELRREHMMRRLEEFWEYETGLIPPLTFGPNRRVGAYGAYIVSIDLETETFADTGRWIEPSD